MLVPLGLFLLLPLAQGRPEHIQVLLHLCLIFPLFSLLPLRRLLGLLLLTLLFLLLPLPFLPLC